MSLAEILEVVRGWDPIVTYLALFFGAMIEYIFPPVPGDTVVVAGAVLVGAFGWSLWPVFGIVTLGAIVGSAADFWIGRWLVNSGRLARMKPGPRKAIAGLVARFERHGAWYLAVNRFLPGIRAFFFIAAGLAGLKLRTVLFWSAISAAAWNGILVAIGYALGQNLEALETVLGRYQAVMWILIGAVIVFVGYKFYKASRAKGEDGPSDDLPAG